MTCPLCRHVAWDSGEARCRRQGDREGLPGKFACSIERLGFLPDDCGPEAKFFEVKE